MLWPWPRSAVKMLSFVYNEVMPPLSQRVSSSRNTNLIVIWRLGQRLLKKEGGGTLKQKVLFVESIVQSSCLVKASGTVHLRSKWHLKVHLVSCINLFTFVTTPVTPRGETSIATSLYIFQTIKLRLIVVHTIAVFTWGWGLQSQCIFTLISELRTVGLKPRHTWHHLSWFYLESTFYVPPQTDDPFYKAGRFEGRVLYSV